jgi:hypothetical protein
MSETCLNGHNRAMRKFVALAAIALIAGCAAVEETTGTGPRPRRSRRTAAVVSSAPTRPRASSVRRSMSRTERVRHHQGRRSDPRLRRIRPNDAQRNGVAAAGACASTSANPSSSNLAQCRRRSSCLLNAERRGEGPLHAALEREAQASRRRLGTRDGGPPLLRHEAGRSTVQSRIKKTGYIRGNWSLGENIAWGSGALATRRRSSTAGCTHQATGPTSSEASSRHRNRNPAGRTRPGPVRRRDYVTDFGRHG